MKKRWQSNLRHIPEHILAAIKRMTANELVVSCARKIDIEAIKSGEFSHLKISWDEPSPSLPDKMIPLPGAGIYSRRNLYGHEIIHKDLPMTIKTWSINSPNFGDWSKGYHDIDFSRQVYQRDFIGPKFLAIKIDLIGRDIRSDAFIFRFTVDEVLNRTAADFDEKLLFNLNLLQENTGNHGVQQINAEVEDYLNTLYVNWEILPPGNREETLAWVLSGSQELNPKIKQQIIERTNFLHSLRPRNFIKGTNEFRKYFGAQFADDLVVFENIEYGNAIYVMFEQWIELSKRSRTELLSSSGQGFERIPHSKTWKIRLKRIIDRELRKRKPKPEAKFS